MGDARDGLAMGTVLASIIVPVYNVGQYIEQCLASLVAQTEQDIEIICVDDCGGDGSMAIVEQFAARDSRIGILRHEKNKGLGQARNTGMQSAKGAFLFFVDSDDWVAPDMVEKVCSVMVAERLDWMWFNYACFLEKNGAYARDAYYARHFGAVHGYVEITSENAQCFPVMAWNKAYRASFVRENGLLWASGLYEDNDFYFRCIVLNPRVYVLNDCFYAYRIRGGSIIDMARKKDLRCEDIFRILRDFHGFLCERGIFEEHRELYANLLALYTNSYINLKGYKERTLTAVRNLLRDIRFPQSLRGSAHFDLFEIIFEETGQARPPFLYWPLRWLSVLMPGKNRRRAFRRKIEWLYRENADLPEVVYDILECQEPFRRDA